MKLVIAPEPAPWLAPLLAALDEPVTLVAPWAIDPRLPLPAALHRRLARRHAPAAARVHLAPGWPVLEHLVRRLTGSIAARLELRTWIDRLVALRLRGAQAARYSAIYAPTLAALHTFAAARARGIETVLIDDLPGLRALHVDLDAAADAVPEATFLRNLRAPARLVVRQEQEWVLATRALAASRRARQRLVRAGLASDRIKPLPQPKGTARLTHAPTSRDVLLAGTAASRHGLEIALRALDLAARSEASQHQPLSTGDGPVHLLVRPAEGAHGPSLRDPRVRLVSPDEPLSVAAVIAPSWAEAQLPELSVAADAGIPIIATPQALGWLSPGSNVHELRAGDTPALRAALDRILLRAAPAPLATPSRPEPTTATAAPP